MKITSIENAGKQDVYNMEVEDTHCFSVTSGGVIVHNCSDAERYGLYLNRDKETTVGGRRVGV